MIFWNKKEPINVEQTLINDVSKLKAEVSNLKGETLALTQEIDIIRNKVLRKIQIKRQEPEEESDNWAGIPIK